MDQHYDDVFQSLQKATGTCKFMKLPRYQENLKYNFNKLYSYSTNIAHLDLPAGTLVKLAKWSPTTTTTTTTPAEP